MMKNQSLPPQGRIPTLIRVNPGASTLKEIPDGTQPVPLGSGVVTKILGQGGMANVYEIWNEQLEIHKAVKLMHPSAGKECLERFQTEIKICAKLNHPNIVEIHSVGEWHGLPYIEMERLEGITLEELLKKRGPLPSAVVIAAGILACRGLAFAHKHRYQLYEKNYHGVIHRDLKPSNIMFCNDGQIKIMDFGIARPLDASLHTTDGGIVGTLQYLSPEQLNAGALDVRTDIYSLGETLYEALCGCQAFPEKSVTILLGDKSKNRYNPLTNYHLNAPKELMRLIHKSMSRDSENRIPDATAFCNQLMAVGHKMGISDPQETIRQYMESTEIRPVHVASRKSFPYVQVIAALFFLVSIVSSIILLRKPSENSVVSAGKVPEVVKDTISALPVEGASFPAPVKSPDVKGSDSVTATEKEASRIVPQPVGKRHIVTQSVVPLHQKSTPATPDRKVTAIEQFQAELGISDLSALISALYTQKRYKDVLIVYNESSSDVAQVPRIAVLALRSQIALGNSNGVDKFLSAHSINDAEFFLQRARQALARKQIEQALSFISSAESAPKIMLNYDDLHRETTYIRALCASGMFDNTPNEETYKNALDKWRDVRAALASNSSHEYLMVEREERKRMGQVYASVKDQK